MRSWVSVALAGALSTFGLMAACSSDKERPSAPPSSEGSGAGPAIPSGGNTSDPTPCQCAASLGAEACATCLEQQTEACASDGYDPFSDPIVSDCIAAADYAPDAMAACLTDGAAGPLTSFLECGCGACAASCTSEEPATCELGDAPEGCACILAAQGLASCQTCAQDADSSRCSAERTACDEDEDCAATLLCLGACEPNAAGQACVETCFATAGQALAEAYFSCLCAGCGAACLDDVQGCPSMGFGGSGGTGGSGGSGGSGGTGGAAGGAGGSGASGGSGGSGGPATGGAGGTGGASNGGSGAAAR